LEATLRKVLSVAAPYSISLTPRFSEVHGQVYGHNGFIGLPAPLQKNAEALGAGSDAVNTPLKQGVNEKLQSTPHSYSLSERRNE
jgi:hypothetical protein